MDSGAAQGGVMSSAALAISRQDGGGRDRQRLAACDTLAATCGPPTAP
jgi:hypothetical protein